MSQGKSSNTSKEQSTHYCGTGRRWFRKKNMGSDDSVASRGSAKAPPRRWEFVKRCDTYEVAHNTLEHLGPIEPADEGVDDHEADVEEVTANMAAMHPNVGIAEAWRQGRCDHRCDTRNCQNDCVLELYHDHGSAEPHQCQMHGGIPAPWVCTCTPW